LLKINRYSICNFGDFFMLIISRRIGEKIVIGDDVISIMILSVKGAQVRIGIDAPREIDVHREEIYLKIQNELQKLDVNDS